MIQDALDLIILLAWLILIIVALRQVLRAARKSGKVFAALRTLVSYRWLIYTLGVAALTLVKASLVFVYPQEAGVVVSMFSQDGVRQQPLRGGLHWVVPLAERLAVYPLYWQTYEMSRLPTENLSGDTVMVRTRDGQEVILDSTIIFRVDPGHVVSMHVQWQDRYLRQFVHPMLRGVLRDEVSRYTAEELNSFDRTELIAEMESQLRKAGEKNGLIVSAFLLRNLAFLKGYAESVEQKQIALERQQTRVYQAKRIEALARGREQRIKLLAAARAQAIVVKAGARKQARIIRKKADAEALHLVKGALKDYPHMLTCRYIDQLSPERAVMIIEDGKSSVIFR
jgi:regulator of protease activity HflC (stomatin/prohibitin superfamily)